jgi:L-lactate dehydrogenase (cytochrome)
MSVPPRRLRRILALDDFEAAARRHLPRPIFGYIVNGSETNSSRDDNRAAFRENWLVPRALVDVSARTQRTELFGHTYASPFGIAPVGFSALAAFRGDVVLAQAASELNIPMIMSGASLIPLEEVARAAPHAWYQAYLPGKVDLIRAHLDRIAAAGFETLVITVDVPVVSNRENAIRTGFSAPLRPSLRLVWDGMMRPRWSCGTFLRTLLKHGMPHFETSSPEQGPPIIARHIAHQLDGRDRFDWTYLQHVRKNWPGLLVLKGLLRADDARMAIDHGVDGIIVSNHGGRQLDCAPSPLRMLPSIVEAVGGHVPILYDGGIRRGTDVLKALALGANFVFLGRPFIYAAAVGGHAGVARAANLLQFEIDRDLALLGIASACEINAEMLLAPAAL